MIESDEELTVRFERDVVPLISQLYGGARRMTNRPADAEDLVQETMLKAFAQFRTFRRGTYLKAWLFRIMYNTWVSGYRHTERQPQEILSGGIGDMQFASVSSVCLRSAETEMLDGLLGGEITTAVERLHDDLRRIVHYACVDGLRYKEIAVLMGIPVGTVMSRLHRARKHLRAELADLAVECGVARSRGRAEAV